MRQILFLTFSILLFTLASCTKEALPESETVLSETIESPELRASSTCRSPANSALVSYSPGSTKVNWLPITDPVAGPSPDRMFRIYVPSNYNSQAESYFPLVYMFHGRNHTALNAELRSTWTALAESEGFIVVFPEALTYDVNGTVMTHWNVPELAGRVPTGTILFDDVFFFRQMTKNIGLTLRIDCNRIYSCGFSNGNNFNKRRLRVEASDLLAATCGSGNIGDLAVRLPINGIQRPHFDVCGTLDNKAIDFCQRAGETFTELPLGPGAMVNTPCIRDRVDALRQGMEMNIASNIVQGTHANGRQFTDIGFTMPMNGQVREYRFRMVDGLTHKIPSSNNNFNPDYMAGFWVWLQQWER